MRQSSFQPQVGFTLIELIMALAILMVLISVSLPAVGSLLHANQAHSARSALLTALNLARIAAATRSTEVVVCPSSNQTTCDRNNLWQQGWIVFEDRDHSATRSTDEPLLSISQMQPGTAIVTSLGREHVTYRTDGSATGTNLTFTLCDKRGAKHASTVVINNGGRVRTGKPTDEEAATACAAL